jgi:hypothetical protein
VSRDEDELEIFDLSDLYTERVNRYAEYDRMRLPASIDVLIESSHRGLREFLEFRPHGDEWLLELAKSARKPVNWRRDGF